MTAPSTRLRLLLPLLAGIVLVAGVLYALRKSHRPRPALRVGDYILSTKDIEQRDRVARILFPKDPRRLGRGQLRHAYQYAQILKSHGFPLNEEALLAEQERIQLTTQRPDLLLEIQKIFGRDMEAYRRVYILPELAERAIYFDFFLHDPETQRESRAKVEAFLEEAKRLGFTQAAQARRLKATTFKLTRVRRELSSDDEGAVLSPEGAHHLLDLAVPLSAPALLPIPVDNGETWLAARLVEKRRDAAQTLVLQCLTFPKQAFGPWGESQIARIPVADLTP